MRRLLILILMLAAFPTFGSEEYPLLPADISCPRATIKSFVENCELAYNFLENEGRDISDPGKRLEVEDALRGITRCLNVGDIAEFRRDSIGKEAAVALKEVLDRIDLPKESKIPDRKAMTNDDGSLIKRWTIPNTEITLELIEEGRFSGSYQFSQDTVLRASKYYQRIEHLPYKKGATEGFADTYLTTPGSLWLEEVVKRLPSAAHDR